MNICFFINDLGFGGAERVVALVSGELAARGHDVSLITVVTRDADAYPVGPGVTRLGLVPPDSPAASASPGSSSASGASAASGKRGAPGAGAGRGYWGRLLRKRRIRKALKRELLDRGIDVVVSFGVRASLRALHACRSTGVPVVVSERNDPSRPDEPVRVRFAKHRHFTRAARLVLQSAYAQEHYRKRGYTNTTVIPNPVFPPARVTRTVTEKNILAVGRLEHQKGFDLLLKAFSAARKAVAETAPDSGWVLNILGDGREKDRLERLAGELGIAERVRFHGKTREIGCYYWNADVFVSSSRWEGFPNVLLEAMSVGLPVAAFACPGGVTDLVRDGENGLLVEREDWSGLSVALSGLMTDPELRDRLGSRARETAAGYSLNRIGDLWEVCIRDVGVSTHGADRA
jgi:GalNAc-alpha-(1->4)-GalNAc-alpha-(1->3)-diNAcBac-PP-undecaprenol alpha-1,4-N-acetyl-D-galactosaminyltransferase